jgi:putative ABC transport system permease protein
MFTHYFKIAFRNMRKYRTQSLTGIFGLTFGLACFVPALYWMRYETSYDNFYPDAEHIYRIYAVDKQSGKVNELVPGIVKKKMNEQFPETENSTIFFPEINNCKAGETPHIRLHTLNTDSAFFRVFTQEFVSGNVLQALQTMYNIVLTESVAIRLFGDAEKAVGQQLQSTFYFFNPPYTVTAVVKDPPPHTNLPFDALLFHDLLSGYANLREEYQWVQFYAQLYVKLHPLTDIDNLAEKLRDMPSQLKGNPNIELRMAPVSDVRHQLNAGTPFTLNFIRLFVAAGILLLFSAVFNFLNLHLDLFHQRNRELRLRTVHGATGVQLVRQMLFELTCAILPALLFAGCFVVFVRPLFSALLDLEMELSQLIQLFAVCGTGVMVLMLFAGYITFRRLSYLAVRNPSKRNTTGQPALRRVAVTLQLAVGLVFIVAALVVMMQIRFVNRKDLGFDRSSIIQLYGLPPYMQMNLRTALIHELQAIPQIKNITTSNFEPQYSANTIEMISLVEWPGKSPDEKPVFNVIPTDSRFAETFGLKMLMGEWYSEGGAKKIVLNEEAVRVMGLDEPVGAIIRMSIDDVDMDISKEEYEVVGVVSDFHTLSLRSRIHPTLFRHTLTSSTSGIAADNILYMRVTPGQEQEAIRRITAVLPGIDPSFADLRLMTLDDLYDSFNHSEQVGLKIFSLLATICLLISLFGIYAVAAAATRRRRREIAIRKVVGAEAGEIVRMFFHEHTLQVIIAGAVALPPVYIAMSRWLQGYAYRTDIPWWLLTGVIAGVIAVVLLTVLGQVLKVANGNPAEVVKSE